MSNTTHPTTIRIPAPLRSLAGGASEIAVEAATVRDALRHLELRHRGLTERILDGNGGLRGFVNIYLGDEDIRDHGGLDEPLAGSTVISIIPAVAGGLP